MKNWILRASQHKNAAQIWWTCAWLTFACPASTVFLFAAGFDSGSDALIVISTITFFVPFATIIPLALSLQPVLGESEARRSKQGRAVLFLAGFGQFLLGLFFLEIASTGLAA